MSDEGVTITPLENGPYLVKGPVVVRDADGVEYRAERTTIALCRCGGSVSTLTGNGARTARPIRTKRKATEPPDHGATNAPRFLVKAVPVTYRYDSSMARALDWDANPVRATTAFLLGCIENAAARPAANNFHSRSVRASISAIRCAVRRQRATRHRWRGPGSCGASGVPAPSGSPAAGPVHRAFYTLELDHRGGQISGERQDDARRL